MFGICKDLSEIFQWNARISRNISIEKENTEKIRLVTGTTRAQKVSRNTNNSRAEVRVCKSFNKILLFIDPAPNSSVDDQKKNFTFHAVGTYEEEKQKNTKQNKTESKQKDEMRRAIEV